MTKKAILCGIVPAILLTLPIGSVYAFSMFAPALSDSCNASMRCVQYAFSLSIFFLGMGAAFFGQIVEKDPRKAGFIVPMPRKGNLLQRLP